MIYIIRELLWFVWRATKLSGVFPPNFRAQIRHMTCFSGISPSSSICVISIFSMMKTAPHYSTASYLVSRSSHLPSHVQLFLCRCDLVPSSLRNTPAALRHVTSQIICTIPYPPFYWAYPTIHYCNLLLFRNVLCPLKYFSYCTFILWFTTSQTARPLVHTIGPHVTVPSPACVHIGYHGNNHRIVPMTTHC